MKKLSHTNSSVKNVVAAVLVYFSRFIGLMPNFSPLGSFGFFGSSPLLFFAIIALFDFTKGGFYPGFIFTYLGFASYVVLGKLAKKNSQKLVLLPTASFLFFLISNFGVWLYWYDHTFEALLRCYLVALPFYKNTLISDMFFGYGYMGMKALSKRKKSIANIANIQTTQLNFKK